MIGGVKTGQFSVPVATPIQGSIRKDPEEKRIYVGVPDVTACLALIEQSGGSIDVPRFEVPDVVVLGLFRDPAGNPMGSRYSAGKNLVRDYNEWRHVSLGEFLLPG